MKKFLAATLAILYLSTLTGTTIYMHYCMGRLVEWGLRESNNSICSNCGMEKKPELSKGCCKDEYKQIKIDKDHKLPLNYIRLNEARAEAAPISLEYSTLTPLFSPAGFTKINAPPPGCGIPLTLLNCIFRI
jgi:hypothetical protein